MCIRDRVRHVQRDFQLYEHMNLPHNAVNITVASMTYIVRFQLHISYIVWLISSSACLSNCLSRFLFLLHFFHKLFILFFWFFVSIILSLFIIFMPYDLHGSQLIHRFIDSLNLENLGFIEECNPRKSAVSVRIWHSNFHLFYRYWKKWVVCFWPITSETLQKIKVTRTRSRHHNSSLYFELGVILRTVYWSQSNSCALRIFHLFLFRYPYYIQ